MSDPQAPEPEEPADSESDREQAARLLRIVAVIVFAEALAALAFSITEFAHVDTRRPTVAVTTGAFVLLYAVGLGLSAYGAYRLRRWCRSPIVLTQLIQLGLAWSFLGGATTWISVALAVPAVAVLVVVFLPGSTQLLYGHRLRDHYDPP